MSKRNTAPFQSVWRDVEEGRFTDRSKYSPTSSQPSHTLRSVLPVRGRTQLIAAGILFLLTVLFIRSHYLGQVQVLQRQIDAVGRGEGGVVRPKQEQFAIVTFETRDVSYWKESLGNKYMYAERHG